MPHSAVRRLLCTVLPLLGSLAGTAAMAQAGHAHVHGEVALEIVIEPRSISLRLEAPQDSLLGHERRPRTVAEKQAADAVLKRLQDGSSLFGLPAERRCKLASAQIDAPLLAPAAASAATTQATAADTHAEVEASYRFDCAGTDGLRALDLGGLLDAFARIQRVNAQVAGSSGQHKTELRRPARQLAWGR